MAHKIIGVDVDGVLARFEYGFVPIIEDVTGIKFPELGSPDWPSTWHWDREKGVTPKQEAECWRRVAANNTFWFDLPAYPDAEEFLRDVPEPDNLYFITQRSGALAKLQTEAWLESHGFPHPTVLVSGDKGACCKALKITHYIDDKNENTEDVRDNARDTKIFMLARPWNEERLGIPRIDTLAEFIAAIKEEQS